VVDEEITFTFQENSPQRLDKYLAVHYPQISRARWQALIKEGLITINGSPVYKSGFSLQPGDLVKASLPPTKPAQLQPEPIALDILYEDDNLIVVNKPAGMVVHPAAGHDHGTLVQAILAHAPQIQGVGGEQRPGVVHRLDKDTSGIILLAKNDAAHHWLQEQFRTRQAQKVYLALVDGKPPTPNGRIDAAIGRSPQQRKQMAIVISAKGRTAQSEYHTIESFPNHTLLEVHPITGRTHQIRLHLKFIGCPVVGDTVYGRKTPSIPLHRHFLHAARLTIRLPGDKIAHTFEAPLPTELKEILESLRKSGG
jgi:23S rRNA pseudouridine1911/1915/1917 synthase